MLYTEKRPESIVPSASVILCHKQIWGQGGAGLSLSGGKGVRVANRNRTLTGTLSASRARHGQDTKPQKRCSVGGWRRLAVGGGWWSLGAALKGRPDHKKWGFLRTAFGGGGGSGSFGGLQTALPPPNHVRKLVLRKN